MLDLGLSSIIGSGLSAGLNLFGQSKSLNAQKEIAQNAHQWEVADLKAAGLNPILSAGGSGASASGGTSAAAMPDFAESLKKGAERKKISMENKLSNEGMKVLSKDHRMRKILSVGRVATMAGVSPHMALALSGLVNYKDIMGNDGGVQKLLKEVFGMGALDDKAVDAQYPDKNRKGPLLNLHGPTIRKESR